MTDPAPLRLILLGLGMLLTLSAAAVDAESLPPPPPLVEERFGVVATYDSPDGARAAGVGWTRVLFWWHQLQPGSVDDWNPYYFPDGQLNRELNDGREMVGLLAGTPPWASPGGSVRAVPDGLYLPFDHPDNLWGRFVLKISGRYAGQIDRWIIWNEPDIWDDAHPGKSWDGTVGDYVQLLRVARQAARAANPAAQIHLAATTYWWDAEYGRDLYFTRVLDAIRAHPEAAALDDFFDVATLHVYFNPEQVYDLTTLHRRALDTRGFGDKPLWINETNAPPSEDPAHPAPGLRFSVTLEEQAAFLVQGWAMGLAAGAERIAVYKMQDEPTLGAGVEPYGLQRRDGTVRPFFWAYRSLTSYLGRSEGARLSREGPIRRVVVERGALGRTTVLWNRAPTPRQVEVVAAGPSALLADPWGAVRFLTPDGGRYRITLPAARHDQVGGRPYLIVEGAGIHVELPRPAGAPADQSALPPPPVPPNPAPVPPGQPNPSVPDGRWFTETGGGAGGFAVRDDAEARFWSEFQRLGGSAVVGYPISHRYVQDGFVTQAFQKLILQWRPEVGAAWPVNLFDDLSAAGLDDRLLESRQTPRRLPSESVDPPGATWDEVVTIRRALLDVNPAIRAAYEGAADPLTLFGLPTSRVEDMGNHFAVRTQRAVFQQWKEAVPWAAAGQVTIANGGDLAREAGALPPEALVPAPAP